MLKSIKKRNYNGMNKLIPCNVSKENYTLQAFLKHGENTAFL